MFNLPNLSSKALLLSGASLAAILITAPAQATTLGGMTGRNAAQINMTTPPPRPPGFGGATTPDQAKQATSQSSADFSTALARIQAQMSAQATARSAAIAGPNNLGADPNHPGQQLLDVPNGLGAGGLVAHTNPSSSDVANGLVWENANAPTQSTSGANTTVTVQQTAQKAILTWDSFNVGKNTTVHFDQAKGTAADGSNEWIALNRITDPTERPSQILGQIKAEGSVYLINRNGIMFSGTAQVNTHSLIVSTLPLLQDNNRTVAQANQQFLAGGIVDPTFNDGAVLGSAGAFAPLTGDITIEAGAQIETKEGGFALIAGNNVSNAGSIVSNGGQAILYAGTGLTFGAAGTNGQLGLVNVGSPALVDGRFPELSVVNTGTILGLRGNVSLLGETIEQSGLLMATTSIAQPGSISINAKNVVSTVGGAVIFAPDSLTAVLPDADGGTTSTTSAADDVFEPGSISVNGSAFWFQHDSELYAPGTAVTLVGSGGQTTLDVLLHGVELNRVQVDEGAILSVAGLADVERPMSDNLVTVPRLGQNELADSPLQRDGILYKSPFVVDSRDSGTRDDGLSWVGTPVANVSGYVQGVPRTVNELLVNGGSLSVSNVGSIVVRPSATLDVSGGYIHYLGGMVQTTRLIGADGRIYDAANADPLMTYTSLAGVQTVTHDRWAITDTYTDSLFSGAVFESGYVTGGKGGSLTLSSTQMILAGAVLGETVIGRYQTGSGKEPQGASLSLNTVGLRISDSGTDFASLSADFGAGSLLSTPELLALPTNDIDNILWTPNISSNIINAGGFGTVSLTAAMITIDTSAALAVLPGGSINLTGSKMDVLGSLIAHAGQINLVSTGITTGAYFRSNQSDQSINATVLYPADQTIPLRGDILIGGRALLDVSGLWVNDQGLGLDAQIGNSFANGGSISLKTIATGSLGRSGAVDTTGSILLEQGSVLNASGGGYVDMLGRVATQNGIPLGRGGDVSLSIYADSGLWAIGLLPDISAGSKDPLTGARLEMDGTIKGYGLSGGGALTIQALELQIGGDAASLPDYTTYLSQDWFANQGFGAYKLNAIYDATIADGVAVRVSQRNYVADLTKLAHLGTGSDIESVATLGTLDPYHRQATDFALSAGTYLTWNASPANRGPASPNFTGVSGSVVLGEGAIIQADASAAVSLSAYGQLDILGTINAHGGSVDLAAILNRGPGYDYSSRSIWLGKDSLIDVSGTTLIDPFAAPVRSGGGTKIPVSGVVLDGGSVSIQGNNAFVVAEEGSRIDVSGARAALDIRTKSSNLFAPVAWMPTDVASNGGSIVLGSTNGLYFDGALAAAGGSGAARGGTLQIASIPVFEGSAGIGALPSASGLLLQQSGNLVTDGMSMGGAIEGGSISQTMHFAVDRLNGSGIDTLVLGDDPTRTSASYNNFPPAVLNTIAFAGDVNLSLGRAVVMNAHNYLGLAEDSTNIPAQSASFVSVGNTRVSIDAGYVALAGGGLSDITPVLAGGDATLDVSARQIDLMGQFTLQRFGEANFTSSGDIRLMMPAELGYVGLVQRPGELVTAGNLTFKAGQVYPATGNVFLIAAPTEGSTIAFFGNGSVAPPISAGGALLVDAANIIQDGAIRAPSGTIQLGIGDIGDASIKVAFNNLPVIHTSSVTLGNGSLTSVSLDGQSLPYGSTTDGTDWALVVENSAGTKTTLAALDQAPEKLIGLAGDTVDFGKGATVDLSGGGNLYAQEFVPGTGGSRDLLNAVNTSYSSGAQAAQVPLYADGREVYAIVPGYAAPTAAYDPSFGYTGKDLVSSLGKAVYLSGVKGLPDGIYTLLPGQYATIPGAFRVVQQTGTIDSVSGDNVVLADGGNVVSGRFVDALTGKQDARTTSFLVQSTDAGVWQQYSEYTITQADTYFPGQAAHAGTTGTRTPVDAGRLVLAAVNELILDGTLNAKAGDKGRGAAVDISAQAIQIVGGSGEVRDGYLQVDATALSNLGAESLLIGGTRSDTVNGTVVNAVSTGVLLSNDSGSALTGPEVMLVTAAGGNGLVLESGSVLTAKGDIANPSTAPILIGTAGGASGDGALVRVSNGSPVTVFRANVPGLDGVAGTSTGLLEIRSGASINGGKATVLDSSGNLLFDPGANFTGDAIDVNANSVAFIGDGSTATPTGFVVSNALLAQLANVTTLGLHSRSTMTFYGAVDLATKQTLVLGASAFASDGGTVTITAPNLILLNDVGGASSFAAGAGTLTLSTGELDFGTGNVTLQGFGSVTAVASQGIVGQGTGSFDFGSVDVTMTAPVFTVDSGANTSIKTTGALVLERGVGTSIDRETLGGALSLSGGRLITDATISALAGNVSLAATTGDLTLLGGAVLSAKGYDKTFFDTDGYAPGGNLSLTASAGAIDIQDGTTLDFSGSDKGGDAGGLTLSASGSVNLGGTLKGNAASGDYRGGRLMLSSGGAVDLDHIADLSNAAGITGGLSISSGAGNLTLSAGKTLTGQVIYLAANGGDHPSDTDGNLIINGMIDVSGEAAGHIDLFGASGVDVSGKLLATSSVPEQDGGVVSIGTAGVTDGTFNGQYGYENVQATDSGAIRIRASALIDVSGGSADAGGQVSFRAPLLSYGDVKIAIDGGNANIKGAKRVTIEPYAKWSTADAQIDKSKYFDGIIDPAGWYGADGKLVTGQWTDDKGNVLAAPTDDATLKDYLSKDYFTPTTANADHVSFYGFAGGDAANGPGTLMGFIETPRFGFSDRYADIAGLHIRPGIELANPGDTVNGGNVDVLTNWNLGAGETGITGGVTLAYRYGAEAPILTVRAEHDISVKASITDGFYQQNDGAHLQDPVAPPSGGNSNPAYDTALNAYLLSKDFLDSNDGLWNGTINLVVSGGTADIRNDPNYEPLRAPLTNQSTNYYNNYGAYIGEIGQGNGDGMWADLYFTVNNLFGGFAAYSPNDNPNGDKLKTPGQFSSYSDYNNYYQQWIQTNFFTNFNDLTDPLTTPIPLAQPIDTDYAAYSQNYQGTYIPGHNQYMFYVLSSVGLPGFAGVQLFYAPFAPRADAITGGGGVVVPIAQPGPDNSPSNMPIAGRPTSLASATLLGGESSSYRFVAGADFGAADAMAINRLTGTGSVSLDGHFGVVDSTTTDDAGNMLNPRNPAVGKTVMLPNVIRTGIGSIDIAAAGDITLDDPLAPGAIYTGGEPTAGTSTGTAISVVRPALFGGQLVSYNDAPTFLATPLVQPDNGGDITLTAGGDIQGNQQIFDVDGTITGRKGAYIAQYWYPWLNSGNQNRNASTINFGNFDQGVLSAGGDVSVLAGGDIRELSVSLPTTWYLTGDGPRAAQTVNTVGGGNLSVEAGGNILGGSYLVAKGTGRIDAGGNIGPSFVYQSVTQPGLVSPVSTILGIQDAQVQVTARGDLDLGRVQNPGDIAFDPYQSDQPFLTSLTPYTPVSSLRLTSVIGDIGFDTLNTPNNFFSSYISQPNIAKLNVYLPATLEMNALDGGIAVDAGVALYPSADGQLSMLASGDIQFMITSSSAVQSFGMSQSKQSSILNPALFPVDGISNDIDGLLHANDPQPVRIYSLSGDIIDGPQGDQDNANALQLLLPKPAEIHAGRDIVNLVFLGQNLNDSDVTSIIAGRDIIDPPPRPGITPGLIQLSGPGQLDIQAGRDLGPLSRDLNDINFSNTGRFLPSTGIQTVGNLYNPYLPREGADISVLFGTGPGVAWNAFATAYLDPAAMGTELPSFNADLIAAVAKYQADVDKRVHGDDTLQPLSADQAWAAFQVMPEAQRETLVEKIFFKILAITGADYNNPDSPFFNKYARGYQAIEALFPAALGYTKNNLEGGENGAADPITTGNLDIRGSTIQTELGGDISIMGPGGQLLVGSTASPPYVPATGNNGGIGPQSQGILAWGPGSVNIFSDQSLLLAQSRIFTERGGDMTIWSSNGDINAGKGSKTSSEINPVGFTCSVDFYCRIDGASEVTGAGIAAFAGQLGDPEPTVTLVAPRGTVDAGDAGIRVAGDLIIAAQSVANADNIQVSGKAVGLPPKPVTNLTLTTASTAATEAASLTNAMKAQQPQTQVNVEVTGFGGDFNQPEECLPTSKRGCGPN